MWRSYDDRFKEAAIQPKSAPRGPLVQSCQILVGCFLSKLIDVLFSHLLIFPSIGGELPELVLTGPKASGVPTSIVAFLILELAQPHAVVSGCTMTYHRYSGLYLHQ